MSTKPPEATLLPPVTLKEEPDDGDGNGRGSAASLTLPDWLKPLEEVEASPPWTLNPLRDPADIENARELAFAQYQLYYRPSDMGHYTPDSDQFSAFYPNPGMLEDVLGMMDAQGHVVATALFEYSEGGFGGQALVKPLDADAIAIGPDESVLEIGRLAFAHVTLHQMYPSEAERGRFYHTFFHRVLDLALQTPTDRLFMVVRPNLLEILQRCGFRFAVHPCRLLNVDEHTPETQFHYDLLPDYFRNGDPDETPLIIESLDFLSERAAVLASSRAPNWPNREI